MSRPLLPSVAPIVAPVASCVSHHRPQQGVPTCLSTGREQSWKTARTLHNIILHMRAHFMLWEQFIRPGLKAVRTLVIRPLQGYGNTASLSCPDTWVRKPDCLHLPYGINSCCSIYINNRQIYSNLNYFSLFNLYETRNFKSYLFKANLGRLKKIYSLKSI